MPELPEVETVVRSLKELVIGEEIVAVDILWENIIAYPDPETFKKKLLNESIQDISRRGKYIIFHLNNFFLVSHLRMEGKYYLYRQEEKIAKHEHVIFSFASGKQMRYHDTRKFGKMYLYARDEDLKILENVGKEPWDEDLDAQYLFDLAQNRKISLKQFLLDQSVIAGIGNIYVNEICFGVKLMPQTKAAALSLEEWNQVIAETQKVLGAAIKQGGTTIRSYTSSLGVTGLFQQELKVHGRQGEACYDCGSIIEKIRVANRGTYVCKKCQGGEQ